MMEEIDDKEETLSFSDYSINTTAADAAKCDDLSPLESQNSSSIFYPEHYFEFISEEWSITAVASFSPQENIIFCGKLMIPSQNPKPLHENSSLSRSESERDHLDSQKTKPSGEEVQWPKRSVKPLWSKFWVDKVAIPALPRKFRWYFLCGITRFPTKMALRDMQDRQRRKSSSSALFGLGGGEKKKKKTSARRNEKARD